MRGTWRIAALIPALIGMCLGTAIFAQQLPAPVDDAGQGASSQLRSPVLTIDADRIFEDTLFGQRIVEDLNVVGERLTAQNRRIEAELTSEESALTVRRAGMEPEVFRQAADAFDMRVQDIRREQDAKERAFQQALTQGRDAFYSAATQVMGQLMVDAGAVVILDRRAVFLSVGLVDITDEAIAAIDRQLADGRQVLPELALPDILSESSLPLDADQPTDAAPGAE